MKEMKPMKKTIELEISKKMLCKSCISDFRVLCDSEHQCDSKEPIKSDEEG